MKWMRANWVAVLFVLAIAVAFAVNNAESTSRDRAQHDQLVSGCVRTSARTAVLAAGQFDIHRARIARGEPAEARKAEALGNGLVLTIAPPASLHTLAQREVLAQVDTHRDAAGRAYVTPTAHARALHLEGCLLAYR